MDYSLTVRVLVGDDEKEFIVRQCLLTRTFEFFKAACSKRWKEGQERVIRLPDQELSTWTPYLHWVFREELWSANDTEVEAWHHLIHSWITGDQYGDQHLQNEAIDGLESQYLTDYYLPEPELVRHVWDHTVPNSPLRLFFLDALRFLSFRG